MAVDGRGFTLKIVHVVGARPNFMKVAPTYKAIIAYGFQQKVIHTGQHYDHLMSEVFFREFEMPTPEINLGVGSASHSVQTAEIMIRLEEEFNANRPDLVLVYGDVNSTMAAALVCAKLLIPLGHVEAGLRSFDRTMPEEINRVVTDRLAGLLFTPSKDGDENLIREGMDVGSIHRVGNVMIDTLTQFLPLAERNGYGDSHGLKKNGYILVTLHRPSNVDEPSILKSLLGSLSEISREIPVVFPVHPRTRERMESQVINLSQKSSIRFIDPVGYLDFLNLQRNAASVITDSGGIQEETTYLGIPCITVRENTERPVTVDVGTNILVGFDADQLRGAVECVLQGKWKKGAIPPLWDGKTADRIAKVISAWFAARS